MEKGLWSNVGLRLLWNLTRHSPGHPAGCTIPSVTQDTGRSVQGQQPPHLHPGGPGARTATGKGPQS